MFEEQNHQVFEHSQHSLHDGTQPELDALQTNAPSTIERIREGLQLQLLVSLDQAHLLRLQWSLLWLIFWWKPDLVPERPHLNVVHPQTNPHQNQTGFHGQRREGSAWGHCQVDIVVIGLDGVCTGEQERSAECGIRIALAGTRIPVWDGKLQLHGWFYQWSLLLIPECLQVGWCEVRSEDQRKQLCHCSWSQLSDSKIEEG